MAATSAFAKAPVGQNILGKAMAWVAIAIATIVATIVTFGAAAGAVIGSTVGIALSTAMIGAMAGALGTGVMMTTAIVAGVAAAVAVGAAVTATIVAADVAPGNSALQQTKDEMRFQQEQAELNSSPTHGQFFANDWNYQEKITTDYDRETNTCKRCITSRKCKKSKWSLIRNRYCTSWEKWEEEPRCNELQF